MVSSIPIALLVGATCRMGHLRLGPIQRLDGDAKAINALLDVEDMPFLWFAVRSEKSNEFYWCSGDRYVRTFTPVFKAHGVPPSQISVSHTIYVCSDTPTARQRYTWGSWVNPNIVEAYKEADMPTFPINMNVEESDLLEWVIVRNDKLLSGTP